MVRLHAVFLATLGLGLTSQAWAANNCKHLYEKVLPYDLPLGNSDAYINLHNEMRLSYDCTAAVARAVSEAKGGVFDIKLDLLQASAEASTRVGSAPTASAKVLVLGYEVAREDVDLGSLVDVAISPEPEIDVAGTLHIDVGPVPVPVKYGVLGNAKLNIKGGAEGFGLVLNLLPAAEARVYVQAGVDVMIAQAIVRGDVNLINDLLDNQLSLRYEETEKGYVRFDATSTNHMQALDGNVLLRAYAGIGAMKKTYERDLIRWDGYHRDDVVFDFSDRAVIVQ